MASDGHYNVLLLGRSKSGKSASGNTILGKTAFLSKKSFKSVTQEVQKETVEVHGVTLNVYDTPGLFNSEKNNEEVLEKWKSLLQLDERICTVILILIKVDLFTEEDKQAVIQIENFIPERLVQNTWILFTKGDELKQMQLTVKQFIDEMEELKKLVKRFPNRSHVFDNHTQSRTQVQSLINEIKTAQNTFSEIQLPDHKDPLHRTIVLVGKTGVGKSSTGNTILREQRFRTSQSLTSVTSECEIRHGEIFRRSVSVIDTPGIFDTKQSEEKLAKEIGRSIYLSRPGPHAFLYLQPFNIRFTEQEENVLEKLEKIFGKDMKKYTIILFTYGDLLKEKSVEEFICESESFGRLVEQCGGGYHVFNNEQGNREQVKELLEKIDKMVERNGGTCYSNELFEAAAKIGSFKEFFEKYKKTLLIAAGVAAGGFLSASLAGAIVGGVIAGPVGAAVGVAVGVGIGAAVGACTAAATSFTINTNKDQNSRNNQSCQKPEMERETASDDDGGPESVELVNWSLDVDNSDSCPLIADCNIRKRSKSRNKLITFS